MDVFVDKPLMAATLLLVSLPCLPTGQAQAAASQQKRVTQSEEAWAAATRQISIAPTAPERFPDRWYPVAGTLPEAPGPLTGKPYRAVEVTSYDSVDADGKPIRTESRTTKMRDSAGRERTDSISGSFSVGEVSYPLKDVTVSDPVAHCSFHWLVAVPAEVRAEYDDKVAFVSCAPRQVVYVDMDPFGLAYAHPGSGATILQGQVNGEHYIGLRYLNGMTQGSQSRVTGTETWYSTDLRLLLAYFDLKGDPEHGGTRIQTLTQNNLERVEPDSSLFYPPEGYRIQVQQSQTPSKP